MYIMEDEGDEGEDRSKRSSIILNSISSINEHLLGDLLNWLFYLMGSDRRSHLVLSYLLNTVLFSSSISFSHVCQCRIETQWLSVSPPILRNYALAEMLPAESLLGLSGVLGCNPSLIIRHKFKSSHG